MPELAGNFAGLKAPLPPVYRACWRLIISATLLYHSLPAHREIIEQVRAGTLATALVDGPVQHDEPTAAALSGRAISDFVWIIRSLRKARDAVDETLFAFVLVAHTACGWKAGSAKLAYCSGISWKSSPLMPC